jgi:hypothetical protein
MKRFKTKVITDESQVPDGFRRISVLADSITDQKKLSDAHTEGVIAAVKLMRSTEDRTGPVWVDAEAARLVLAGDKPKAKAKQTTDLQYESVCESLADIASGLGYVVQLLERLATAAEQIATQPKTPQHELLNVINGNQAPWNET